MATPYDEEEDFEVLRAEVQELRGRVNALYSILSGLIKPVRDWDPDLGRNLLRAVSAMPIESIEDHAFSDMLEEFATDFDPSLAKNSPNLVLEPGRQKPPQD